MAITHAKVSAVSDGTDSGAVLPSDWNANHTIAAGTVGATELASNAVTTAKINANAVTAAKLATGMFKSDCVSGAAAGDVTVSAIGVGDELIAVIQITDGTNLTAEFTVAAGKINNTGGTSTSGKKLLVLWIDR